MDDGRSQDGSPAARGDHGGLDFGPAAAAPEKANYRVLARKYRPAGFEDLIGQEPMVRTLKNAFDLGRMHQAYILTGVRGVGKTTTARILARAFNYEVPARDGQPAVDRPTIHMPDYGVHCQAIIESRHVDVIEMDAASHTGIDDIREIIEASRYRPVMARYKVFIIDEVHMLSKQAFNGLLKTLEEPPDHVRFLFATTEIEKVPVTVRSRCQRFDLRRVEADVLIAHLAGICVREGVAIDPDALALIARASEGSVRDSLSILDQAIAHGAGATKIDAASVRAMLGVGDRARVIDLFEAVMKGDVADALAILKDQHDMGAEPSLVLTDLAEFVHFVTRLKLVPDSKLDASVTQDERERGPRFAQGLTLAVLTRAWQILVKGMQELRDSPRPLAAADMTLVRLAYAADMPTPDDVLRKLTSASSESANGGNGGARASASASATSSASGGGRSMATARAERMAEPRMQTVAATEPRMRLTRLEDVVALAQVNRDIQLKTALERDVRLVRFEDGVVEFALEDGASPQVAAHLMRRLQEWTGQRWMVAVVSAEGAPTLRQQAEAREAEATIGVRSHPLVRSALARFPNAEIVAVRMPNAAPQELDAPARPEELSDEIGYADETYTDEDL